MRFEVDESKSHYGGTGKQFVSSTCGSLRDNESSMLPTKPVWATAAAPMCVPEGQTNEPTTAAATTNKKGIRHPDKHVAADSLALAQQRGTHHCAMLESAGVCPPPTPHGRPDWAFFLSGNSLEHECRTAAEHSEERSGSNKPAVGSTPVGPGPDHGCPFPRASPVARIMTRENGEARGVQCKTNRLGVRARDSLDLHALFRRFLNLEL